ncbi:hypothetical protein ACFYY5_29715 [Nocardia elegans]|uniref:Uncharacterized protein n=1 Tax=Nocardia elegans TaxID=300029 RepID=A0ABW6TLN1_9NOCA
MDAAQVLRDAIEAMAERLNCAETANRTEVAMRRDALRVTTTEDGRKTAQWKLINRHPIIRSILVRDDASTAVEWPDELRPAVQPGTVLFGVAGPMDLADAREAYPQHVDLWDAVQSAYWAAVLAATDTPAAAGAQPR